MNSSDTAATAESAVDFICNICGALNRCAESRLQREQPSCEKCGSTVRTRSIVQMLTQELFGANIPLSDLPRLKGLRAIGFSDSEDYAERLASAFDYRNTFYHQEPRFDIANMPENEAGAYDFVIASEVFEHIPPPPENAFRNVFRLLKPAGVFLMTVPYTLGERTAEHFPDLDDYGLMRLRDRTVLVNRTRSGAFQVFDNLIFHGGEGSTLEMRCFSETDLRRLFADAGFSSVRIYADNYRPFGIVRSENWSLPIAGRKQPFQLRQSCVEDVMQQWGRLAARSRSVEDRLRSLASEFDEHIRRAVTRISECEAELKDRTEWAQRLDRDVQERTQWAMKLDAELREQGAVIRRYQAESQERLEWAQNLQREIDALRAELGRTRGALWSKIGRALRLTR